MSTDTADRNVDASPTIKVEIYDQAYTVRSDGDPEYLKELAEYVDQRMREISSGTLTVDSRKVAILAALYIADELHQLQKIHDQADEQLASRSTECSEMLALVRQSTKSRRVLFVRFRVISWIVLVQGK
ncbi:MAG: cell division protein ZapA [Acidobacteria bacterium]|nr:MAG: cell division protein ZapA [Acidobacteriota bacterium]